ncbi:MAG: nicotinate (nicotinamide) nucleotide adenylyltransferase [Chitinophagaceae bacterium]
MNIGLYFGSFNPIHIGHCIIANHVINNTALEQVWFVVSPHNPLKVSTTLLNEYHRLYLVQLAIEGESSLRASDIEFQLPRPSYTIDTLTYLEEKYPANDFSVIMGSDSFQNLKKWKNHEFLVARYKLIVYLRPGFEVTKLTVGTTLLDSPLLQISSTHIRENIRKNKSIRFLVPDKVKEEIERNGYYR